MSLRVERLVFPSRLHNCIVAECHIAFLPNEESLRPIVVFIPGGTRLSRHYNRSLGPANTRQHISSILLLRRQPDFDVHLNVAAYDSRSARTAQPLAAAIRYLHAVFLRQKSSRVPPGEAAQTLPD